MIKLLIQKILIQIIILLSVFTYSLNASSTSSNWQSVVRSSPYTTSKDFHKNISTIRQWVLLNQGFCENADRHILFNNRGQFLGYLDNIIIDNMQDGNLQDGNLQNDKQQNDLSQESKLTQKKLNEIREKLFDEKRVKRWIKGDEETIGYPFALNCNQPHVDIEESIERLLGNQQSDKLWGTWDGITAGKKESPISLIDLVELVYRTKSNLINQPIIAEEFRYFLAQIIIESGARKNSLSKDNALGLLQLKPSVLEDCQIPKKFYLHRMAQVDCAVRLFQQNRRNLQLLFEPIFAALPEHKKSTLFSLLLVQSYHSGIGRINRLLTDPDFNRATLYFAEHHQNFSAEDIASGIIFHNLGRSDLGFASLYYVIDIAITANQLCQKKTIGESWFCQD